MLQPGEFVRVLELNVCRKRRVQRRVSLAGATSREARLRPCVASCLVCTQRSTLPIAVQDEKFCCALDEEVKVLARCCGGSCQNNVVKPGGDCSANDVCVDPPPTGSGSCSSGTVTCMSSYP